MRRVAQTSAIGFVFVFDPLLRQASFSGAVEGNSIAATWIGTGPLVVSGGATPTAIPESLQAGLDGAATASRPQSATFTSAEWGESLGHAETQSAALAYEGLAAISVIASP